MSAAATRSLRTASYTTKTTTTKPHHSHSYRSTTTTTTSDTNMLPIDRLAIHVPTTIDTTETPEYVTKYATGLTRRTTVDDIKLAMLCVVSGNNADEQHLIDTFVMYESWQGNERALDGSLKVYKLVRLWQSLPGDQLSQVKFIIKKRQQQQHKLKVRDMNVKKHFALSPAHEKTWNVKRRNSNAIRKQLYDDDDDDIAPTTTTTTSSSSDEDAPRLRSKTPRQRYASVRKFNRTRKSSVRQQQQQDTIRGAFADLVTKQTEILDKQMSQMASLDENSNSKSRRSVKSLMGKYLSRSKSLDKSSSTKNNELLDNPELCLFGGIGLLTAPDVMDEKQAREYRQLSQDYKNIQQSLASKLTQIDALEHEKKLLMSSGNDEIKNIKRKLKSSVNTSEVQEAKLSDVGRALTRIDDMITLKVQYLNTLEAELQNLEHGGHYSNLTYAQMEQQSAGLVIVDDDNDDQVKTTKQQLVTYNSTSSTTSSVFSSVSQQQQQQQQSPQQQQKTTTFYADNESDTGISSANSEDFNAPQQLETLV